MSVLGQLSTGPQAHSETASETLLKEGLDLIHHTLFHPTEGQRKFVNGVRGFWSLTLGANFTSSLNNIKRVLVQHSQTDSQQAHRDLLQDQTLFELYKTPQELNILGLRMSNTQSSSALTEDAYLQRTMNSKGSVVVPVMEFVDSVFGLLFRILMVYMTYKFYTYEVCRVGQDVDFPHDEKLQQFLYDELYTKEHNNRATQPSLRTWTNVGNKPLKTEDLEAVSVESFPSPAARKRFENEDSLVGQPIEILLELPPGQYLDKFKKLYEGKEPPARSQSLCTKNEKITWVLGILAILYIASSVVVSAILVIALVTQT
jgi:hypothetical protein